jgi:hypothetical protein
MPTFDIYSNNCSNGFSHVSVKNLLCMCLVDCLVARDSRALMPRLEARKPGRSLLHGANNMGQATVIRENAQQLNLNNKMLSWRSILGSPHNLYGVGINVQPQQQK